jgi:hypothetical protein
MSELEDVHKPQVSAAAAEVEDDDEDDDDDEVGWVNDNIPLYSSGPAKIIQMLEILGATGIQPGFEQCLDALITDKKPITRETFNRLCTKVGSHLVGGLEWKRITVRVTAMCVDADVIYNLLNASAENAYDEVCDSLWDDRIPFTLSVAEKRLAEWIEDPTLPGAKAESVDSYRLILQTWQEAFGVASPLEPLFADEIVDD